MFSFSFWPSLLSHLHGRSLEFSILILLYKLLVKWSSNHSCTRRLTANSMVSLFICKLLRMWWSKNCGAFHICYINLQESDWRPWSYRLLICVELSQARCNHVITFMSQVKIYSTLKVITGHHFTSSLYTVCLATPLKSDTLSILYYELLFVTRTSLVCRSWHHQFTW